MRRLSLLLLALLPGLAKAQTVETYQLPATQAQVDIVEADRDGYERRLCSRYNLIKGSTCTQAALCTAAQAAGGASCSAAQARAAEVRLYPSTFAGRDEFVRFDWVAPVFLARKANAQADAGAAYCIWWATQDTPTRNAECAKIGKPNGCEVCPQ